MQMETFIRKCQLENKSGITNKLYIDPELITPEFTTFSDIIECKICSGVVVDPVSCQLCDNIFCKTCINDWLKRKNSECPFRCKYQEFQIRPTTKNMIHKIKLYCSNKLAGCQEILDYEFYFKHLNLCEFNQYECIGCNLKGQKNELRSHVLKCEKLFQNCEYCFEKFTKTEINNHYRECQMFELPCSFCKKSIKRYNYEKHANIECQEAIIKCEYCEIQYKRKYENDHTKKLCFDNYSKNFLLKNNISSLKEENEMLKKELLKRDNIIRDLKKRLQTNGQNPNDLFNNIGPSFEKVKSNIGNFFTGKK